MRKLYILFSILFLFIYCKDKEQMAQEIYEQAKELEKVEGKIVDALKLYDSLVEYDDTMVFEKAKQELLLRGFSIGNCLSSYTIMLLIELENEIAEFYEKKQEKPTMEYFGKHYDAWGKEIKIEWDPKKYVLFQLLSPGADGLDSTKDDLILAYRTKDAHEVLEEEKKQNKGELIVGLGDLAKLKNQDAAEQEMSSTLKQLEKFNSDEINISEKKVNLDDFLGKKKIE